MRPQCLHQGSEFQYVSVAHAFLVPSIALGGVKVLSLVFGLR